MCFFGIVTRFLIIVFGILLPARYTHNALGKDELIGWAKYWIVYACLVTIELVGDTFLHWVPLYMESKLLIVLWLVLTAPQASVWVFDSILNPLLKRYMPRIDNFMQYGKRNLMADFMNYATQICVKCLDTILPVISRLWKKQLKAVAPSISQVLDSATEANNPPFPDRDATNHRNVLYDSNLNEDELDDPLPLSYSTSMVPNQRKLSKLSLQTELNTKLSDKPNRGHRRQQYLPELTNDESNQYEDPLLGMEDLLKSERHAIEMQNRTMTVRKDNRRRI
ncbi:receptor expression-enhancing protein 4 [Drosophila mojavensis]|uniref:Receptor expression-enhancing protein n=1 Tax=Drosophila mojavensis TaxID=7230 RepID=B4KNM7_DROMO|nr:receptor expression-enhancing protein 4 [Drosophila mojavensis]EDW10012.1 uncharacterized protein Dmoj_GI20834 [Drosophila mojavensis]